MTDEMPPDRELWLTSFWGFDPSTWGGIGFTQEYARASFLQAAPAGSLIAIYVTKHKGPEEMRGKLVGFFEMTHDTGSMQSFTSPLDWAQGEREAGVKGKWAYGIHASRAWEVVEEDWADVETIFPLTYAQHNKQIIGANGVPVFAEERAKIYDLWVREVPVYGRGWFNSEHLGPFREVFRPSNAVPPSQSPTLMKEADGPKRLYVLRLEGNYAHFLGRPEDELVDHHVVKVGFSKSPIDRCRQIQSAYPKCQFRWTVAWQHPDPADEAYPNAEVAIAGEDEMKKRLAEEGESLGGEFFLVDDGLFVRTRSIGRFGADEKQKALGLQPVAPSEKV